MHNENNHRTLVHAGRWILVLPLNATGISFVIFFYYKQPTSSCEDVTTAKMELRQRYKEDHKKEIGAPSTPATEIINDQNVARLRRSPPYLPVARL